MGKSRASPAAPGATPAAPAARSSPPQSRQLRLTVSLPSTTASEPLPASRRTALEGRRPPAGSYRFSLPQPPSIPLPYLHVHLCVAPQRLRSPRQLCGCVERGRETGAPAASGTGQGRAAPGRGERHAEPHSVPQAGSAPRSAAGTATAGGQKELRGEGPRPPP